MEKDKNLREHVLYLLRGGGAHIGFDDVIEDFPVEEIGRRVAGVSYSAWQVLEHMRIAQWDILEFSRNPAHVSPPWPAGYWPAATIAPDASMWRQSVAAFRADLEAMAELVADEATDLLAPLAHGDGQTVLREALLLADHNAYHLGVLQTLKRMLVGDSA